MLSSTVKYCLVHFAWTKLRLKVQFITGFKPFNVSFHFVFSSLIFLWLLSWTTLSTLHVTNPFSAHTTSTSLSACGLSLILEPRKLRYIFVFSMFVVSISCWCACCLCVCFFSFFFFNFRFSFFCLFFQGSYKAHRSLSVVKTDVSSSWNRQEMS